MPRFKPVPAPGETTLADAQRAVPLVPGSTEDCCARLMDRAGVPARDDARTWLTFLRALGLAEETPEGYVRTDRDPGAPETRAAFRERVFGAAELLDALGDDPLDAGDAFDVLAPHVPDWERERDDDWRETYRERARRLLAWAAELDFAAETPDGCVARTS